MLVFKSWSFLRDPSFSAYANFPKNYISYPLIRIRPHLDWIPRFTLNIWKIGILWLEESRSELPETSISAKWYYFSVATILLVRRQNFLKKINKTAWTNRLCGQVFSETSLNPFFTTGFSIPPENKKIQTFSVFKRYREKPKAWNGLIHLHWGNKGNH